MTALLIIDYQRAVTINGVAHEMEETKEILKDAVARARAALMPVIFVRHAEAGSDWEEGSEGWRFFDDLSPQEGDYVVDKGSCDAFRNTRLGELLDDLGVESLIIGGYATEFCVDTTVRSAAAKGYRVTVMADGHTTKKRPHLDAPAIKAHHNWIWPNMANPEHEIEVRPATECF